LTPITYRGFVQGGAVIADADGRVLARDRRDGAGFAIADVQAGRAAPADPPPRRRRAQQSTDNCCNYR
jgi:predicted amidohydrolase